MATESGLFILSDFFASYALPFVLIFTLVFAVLQKTKVLGDDASRINSLMGFIIGMIVIGFQYPREIIVYLMPFLAVVLTVLLVFMLPFGFINGKKDGDVLSKWWKIVLIGILAISLLIFLLVITGYWGLVYNYLFFSSSGKTILLNVLLFAIIAGAIIAVLRGEK
ncbi:MAG: hypothetical protein WC867_06810 [Candidatus Pacearchaeota archaeon]|jgi:hypothetical protein